MFGHFTTLCMKGLNLDDSVSINHKTLQILATEMFRVYTGSATDILNEVFSLKPPSNYNLRNQQEFVIRHMKTVYYGLNSLAFELFRTENMGNATE